MADWMIPALLALVVAAVFGFVYWRNHRTAPKGWVIGPVVRGKNYSVNMPLRPDLTPMGWKVRMPPGSQIDAIDIDTDGLPEGGRVRFHLLTHNPDHALIRPHEDPNDVPTVALYFQRKGDTWSAEGEGEFYRWYCNPTVDLVQGGGLDVQFTPENWLAVMGTPGRDRPAEFSKALAKACRIGLTFGSGGARSHGVVTDKPVEFELVQWSVER